MADIENGDWHCRRHNVDTHDIFISYRVQFESLFAGELTRLIEKVGLRRMNRPVNVFWDKNCLNDAENWKDGFLNGLYGSKLLIYLISDASLETLIGKTSAYTQDNVLLEIEAGLKLASQGKSRIFPILIGSLINETYTPFKGSFFSSTQYPNLDHVASGMNVRETMRKFFEINGFPLSELPTKESQLCLTVERILRVLFPFDGPRDWNHQIPPIAKNFTGRDAEQSLIRLSIFLHGISLVIGVPGMGKSTLAAKFAHDNAENYQTVFWISLETVASANIAFEAMAMQLKLKVPENPSAEDYRVAVSRWIEKERGYFLVVDNADDPEILRACFRDVSKFQGDVLVTSRNDRILQYFRGLHLEAEQIVEVDRWDDETTRQYLVQGTGMDVGSDDEAFNTILGYVSGHSLSAAQVVSYIKSKRRMSYSKFVAKMKEVISSESTLPEAENRGSIGHIFRLFTDDCSSLGPLGTRALEILASFSYLSPNNIPRVLIDQIAKIWNDDENFDVDEALNILLDNGWLRLDETMDLLSTHAVIQELARNAESAVASISRVIGSLHSCLPIDPGSLFSPVQSTQCALLTPHIQRLVANILSSPQEVRLEVWNPMKLLLRRWSKFLDHIARLIDAESVFESLTTAETALFGSKSIQISETFYHLGQIEQLKGNYHLSKKMFLESLDISENHYGNLANFDAAYTLYALGQIDSSLGDNSEAEKYFRKSLEIEETLYGTHEKPSIAATLVALGQSVMDRGDYNEAKILFLESLEIQKKHHPTSEHQNIAAILHELGRVNSKLGHHTEAKKLYLESLEIKLKVFGTREHPSVASTLYVVGQNASYLGDYHEAKVLFIECLEIKEKYYGTRDHPEMAVTIHELASTLFNLGEYQEAQKLYQECLNIQVKWYGTREHPSVAATISALGRTTSTLGDDVSAKVFYLESLELQEKLYGTKVHPRVAATMYTLAQLASNVEDYEGAKRIYIECLDIWVKIYGTRDHPNAAVTIRELGGVLCKLGEFEEARLLQTECLNTFVMVYGTREHPSVAIALRELGISNRCLGDFEESKSLLLECLMITQKVYGTTEHRDYAFAQHELGLTLAKLGDEVEATKMLLGSVEILEQVFRTRNHPRIVAILKDLKMLEKRNDVITAKWSKTTKTIVSTTASGNTTTVVKTISSSYSPVK
ncbi:hypothetical protein HDU79_000524 [Rhizoclosmatium sp. JEL0117]|nr:hypothetical protein HDU79_000524 [Rhizoclosmatium sp. JEL0117]